LRISHPVLSIALAVYLFFLSLWVVKAVPDSASAKLWANRLTVLIVIQLAIGGITLVIHAPIVMQLIHLLLADLVWIAFIIMSVEILAEQSANQTRSFPVTP
jgi:heme A synthase